MNERNTSSENSVAVNEFPHVPVLLAQMLDFLPAGNNIAVMDGTYGDGHYSNALLNKGANVFAFDKDPEAIAKGEALKQRDKLEKLHFIHADFGDCQAELRSRDIHQLDAMIFDLGVSSRQLDDGERGFSFRHDGALDMRMAKTGSSAADIINSYDLQQLSRMFKRGGEQKFARAIGKAIIKTREKTPIDRTKPLAELISNVIPNHMQKRGIHPATLAFQAIRIEVNQEFAELEKALLASDSLLREGGRLIVVSFHSLEDKIMMRYLRQYQGTSRYLPESEEQQKYKVLTKKAIIPDEAEMQRNSRARSARMRVAEKC